MPPDLLPEMLERLGHKPTGDGDVCLHHWRNRTTHAVHCAFLAGWLAALRGTSTGLTTADYHREHARAEGLSDLARLLVDGHDNGYPVEGGETWEPDLVERFRDAIADQSDAPSEGPPNAS